MAQHNRIPVRVVLGASGNVAVGAVRSPADSVSESVCPSPASLRRRCAIVLNFSML